MKYTLQLHVYSEVIPLSSVGQIPRWQPNPILLVSKRHSSSQMATAASYLCWAYAGDTLGEEDIHPPALRVQDRQWVYSHLHWLNSQ